jgi:hypothetical protein
MRAGTLSKVDHPASADLVRLFHRLNNQLGVILANSELLESRLTEETHRARAAQVVSGALEAIAAVHELRTVIGASADRPPAS